MLAEAEEFAEQDESLRKRIESLNGLQNFIATMRSQLSDKEGLGAKLDSDDKDTIKTALKDAEEWLQENSEAEASDIDEQLESLQSTVAPITSKVYAAGGDDDSTHYGHGDEL